MKLITLQRMIHRRQELRLSPSLLCFLLLLTQTSCFVQPISHSLKKTTFSTSSHLPNKNIDTVADKENIKETLTKDDDDNTNKQFDDDWIRKEIEIFVCGEEDTLDSYSNNNALLDGPVVGPAQVLIYDTTLRDGTQGESISLSCNDKLKIASELASFGVDFIECGWPGSNPKDMEFFQRAQTELSSPFILDKLVAFGSTRRKNCDVSDDIQIQTLMKCPVPTVCIVAKAHLWQVSEILRATPEENVQMIRDTINHLTKVGKKRVFVDLEHFFDGYKYDEEYAFQCCQAAVEAGAKGLVLCDTNGGSMPWEVEKMTRIMVQQFGGKDGVTVGIHTHNDCGMAVANSMSSIHGGAGMVQGTINGIGERTGNANLCAIVPSLALHQKSKLTCALNLKYITKVSRFMDEILNHSHNPAAPYVGNSAFAHKGGLHVAAMERNPLSYQHVEPQLVGNEMRVLISELSGRQNIMRKMKEMDIQFGGNQSELATSILNRVKRLESIGYTFEGAEASVSLMILHASDEYCAPFRVLDYSAQVFDNDMDFVSRITWLNENHDKEFLSREPSARATVKIRTLNPENESEFIDRLEVAEGNGPIDALALALKKSLVPSYDLLKNVELVDYKVRILDAENATAAAARVMVEFRDPVNNKTWTTVSVDTNVISASLNALIDGFEYSLLSSQHQEMCLLWDNDFQ